MTEFEAAGLPALRAIAAADAANAPEMDSQAQAAVRIADVLHGNRQALYDAMRDLGGAWRGRAAELFQEKADALLHTLWSGEACLAGLAAHLSTVAAEARRANDDITALDDSLVSEVDRADVETRARERMQRAVDLYRQEAGATAEAPLYTGPRARPPDDPPPWTDTLGAPDRSAPPAPAAVPATGMPYRNADPGPRAEFGTVVPPGPLPVAGMPIPAAPAGHPGTGTPPFTPPGGVFTPRPTGGTTPPRIPRPSAPTTEPSRPSGQGRNGAAPDERIRGPQGDRAPKEPADRTRQRTKGAERERTPACKRRRTSEHYPVIGRRKRERDTEDTAPDQTGTTPEEEPETAPTEPGETVRYPVIGRPDDQGGDRRRHV